MKIANTFVKYSTSVLFAAFAFHSGNAAAELRNLPLSISVNTLESLADQETQGVTCRTLTESVGMTTGSGTMSVGYKNRGYVGPVTANARDCATPTFVFSNGKLTITAVNGSTLTADYSGSFGGTAGSPILTMNKDAKFTITGGTGVFEGAYGSGKLSGYVDITNALTSAPLNMPGKLEATGTISFSKTAFETAYKVY
ncbi:hypothetical protein KTQ42_18705 [Noviherbaspirillum sp. L7-7A]|uniref:hypothetical protein n=1 Tax=Noviherbaspirillum sp. L7-7A TaxID=2850560 RepID=UPI001C2CB287|nr:hypothetical protein [Noviherbaspirillum sp. L7-7A]MBV0881325.1 hypothetical protein [Noviherbaspirillum sp. L7-7A]